MCVISCARCDASGSRGGTAKGRRSAGKPDARVCILDFVDRGHMRYACVWLVGEVIEENTTGALGCGRRIM